MDKQEVVATAIEIAEEYEGMGLRLTLRQLYYQFVSRGLIDNGQKQYKRLGAILTEARYSGAFPIRYIEDRGRTVRGSDCNNNQVSVDSAFSRAAGYVNSIPNWVIERAKWYGQPIHVSVWVEKEALSGVFQPECDRLGVGWFACKGYPSVSSLQSWITQTDRFMEQATAEEAVVLYFGDHDPDGWQIPRSAHQGIEQLRSLNPYGPSYNLTFVRCALNMDQVQQYNPPPFPAKPTSARYKKYLAEQQTNDAWELDALEPQVLQALIRSHVEDLFDESIHDDNRELVARRQNQVRERMIQGGGEWLREALR